MAGLAGPEITPLVCVCVCVCVCVLVEPIAEKNVSPSEKKIVAIFEKRLSCREIVV